MFLFFFLIFDLKKLKTKKPGEQPQDLIIILKEVVTDHNWHRENNDLVYEKTIDLMEALCGYEFYFKQLDESYLLIKSEPGVVTQPGDLVKIEGKGMPWKSNPSQFGDLFIKFDVQFPTTVSPEIRQVKETNYFFLQF